MFPIHVFPKFVSHLSAGQLADWCRQLNLDGVDVLVRNKYWVGADNMPETIGPFCASMRAAGLQVYTASIPQTPEELIRDDTPLRILADNGIEMARLGYVKPSTNASLSSQLDSMLREFAILAQVCQRCKVRGVIQMHGGTMHQSASGLFWLLKDISPAALGVMVDPGNMRAQEGHERWDYVVGLLIERIAVVGVKDVVWYQNKARSAEPGKGWRPDWAPLPEGMINWVDTIGQLVALGSQAPLQLAPFYATDDFDRHTQLLHEDIAYLRSIINHKG